MVPVHPLTHPPPTHHAGIAFECRLADGSGNITNSAAHRDWADCSSPASFSGLPDGAYQFSVRAKGETLATSSSFTKDATPPTGVCGVGGWCGGGGGPGGGGAAAGRRAAGCSRGLSQQGGGRLLGVLNAHACMPQAHPAVTPLSDLPSLLRFPDSPDRLPPPPPPPPFPPAVTLSGYAATTRGGYAAGVAPQLQGTTTADAVAVFEFMGSDSTGVAFTCTLSAT